MNPIAVADTGRRNDFRGNVAFDSYNGFSDLADYAKKKGIDTDRYDPIGFNAHYDNESILYLSIIVIDKKRETDQQAGKTTLIEIQLSETLEIFLRLFKRVNVKAFMSHKNLNEFEEVMEVKRLAEISEEGEED